MWRCHFIDEKEEIYFEICFDSLDYLQKMLCILSKPYIHLLDCEYIKEEEAYFNKRSNQTWSLL